MEHCRVSEFTEQKAPVSEMIRQPIESFQRYLLDRMVLRPSRQPLEFIPQQRVMLCKGSTPIECFVQTNFDADRFTPELVVLKFPGTAGRAERSGPFPMSVLSSLRIAMWTWNPPGYGRSKGRASLQKIGESAVEFWHQVSERYPHNPPTWLCGNSLGCVTALNVAAKTDASPNRCGVVLRNPPPLKLVFKRVARTYPLGIWAGPLVDNLCDSMDAMLTAQQCHLPAVFLQSERDMLVPALYQNRLIRTYRGPKRTVIMEGLGHDCVATESHQPRIEKSIRWLWGHFAGT